MLQQPTGIQSEKLCGAPTPRRWSTGRRGVGVARPSQQVGKQYHVLPWAKLGELWGRVEGVRGGSRVRGSCASILTAITINCNICNNPGELIAFSEVQLQLIAFSELQLQLIVIAVNMLAQLPLTLDPPLTPSTRPHSSPSLAHGSTWYCFPTCWDGLATPTPRLPVLHRRGVGVPQSFSLCIPVGCWSTHSSGFYSFSEMRFKLPRSTARIACASL